MKKIYHLSSCSTCVRILKEIDATGHGFELQNIKEEIISPDQLDAIVKQVGSYDALFSRRAMKYKSMGLKDKNLSETDIRNLILGEYTFLKRPVIIIDNDVYVGNSKKTVEAVNVRLGN